MLMKSRPPSLGTLNTKAPKRTDWLPPLTGKFMYAKSPTVPYSSNHAEKQT